MPQPKNLQRLNDIVRAPQGAQTSEPQMHGITVRHKWATRPLSGMRRQFKTHAHYHTRDPRALARGLSRSSALPAAPHYRNFFHCDTRARKDHV